MQIPSQKLVHKPINAVRGFLGGVVKRDNSKKPSKEMDKCLIKVYILPTICWMFSH